MRRETRVGIYALIIIGASCLMIEYLSGTDLLHHTSEYYSYYDDVTGLRPSTPVLIKGVKLGQVTKITIDPDDPSRVKVVYTIPSSYRIPSNSVTRIFSNGLLGGRTVSIDMGDSKTFIEEDGEILSVVQLDIMDKVNQQFDSIKQKIELLIDNTNATVQTLNNVMNENSQAVNVLLSNLGELSRKLNTSSIVSDVEELSKSLKRSGEGVESIVKDATQMTEKLKAAHFAEKLSSSLSNLQALLAKIEKGDGDLGKLLNDGELYTHLTEASLNLGNLLKDVKENPKRYINISVFGGKSRLERAKDKEEKRLYKQQLREERKEERRMNATGK